MKRYEPGGSKILIMTNHRDFAADRVIRLIQDRSDREVQRWNTETIDADIASWEPGQPMLPADVRSVWLRQFLPDAEPLTTVADVDEFLVRREQWRSRLEFTSEAPVRWMNPLFDARRAENKLIQLQTAKTVGLTVPPTLVTSSKTEAVAWSSRQGSCIVKTVTSGFFAFSDQAFAFTTDLTEALAHADQDWAEQPVIVQRRIEPRTDIRVLIVGQDVFGASTTASGPDWRLHNTDTVWEPWPVPHLIAEQSRALIRSLGLLYGALDFAFDGSTAWFLECNQAGEFAFIDRPLDLGVADAIARALCR